MKGRTKKALVALLALLILLIGAPAICVVVAHLRGERQLAAALEKLRERGEALTYSELWPAPAEAGPGGAAAFLSAAGALPATLPEPPAEQWVAPGRVLLRTRMESWRAAGLPGGTGSWAVVSERLRASAEAIDALRASLQGSPRRLFEPDQPPEVWLLPCLSRVKSAQLALGLACLNAAREGNFEEATACLQSMSQLERDLAPQPFLIAQIVRIGCVHGLLACAFEVLHSGEWTDAQLARLGAVLESSGLMEGTVAGIAGERAYALGSRRRAAAAGTPLGPEETRGGLVPLVAPNAEAGNSGGAKLALDWLATRVVLPLWRYGWEARALAEYLETNQGLLDASRKAAARHSPEIFNDEAAPWLALPEPPPSRFQVRGIGPGGIAVGVVVNRSRVDGLASAVSKALRAETQRSMLRARVALERFRLEQGRYPSSLDALVPDLLAELPVDGMDGKPLRYRPEEGGAAFILWSVGTDLEDNGGDPTQTPSGTGRNRSLWSSRDAVLPEPATPAEIAAWEAARTRNGEGMRR